MFFHFFLSAKRPTRKSRSFGLFKLSSSAADSAAVSVAAADSAGSAADSVAAAEPADSAAVSAVYSALPLVSVSFFEVDENPSDSVKLSIPQSPPSIQIALNRN